MKIEQREIDGETWIKFDSKYEEFKHRFGYMVTIVLILFMVGCAIVLFYSLYNHIDLLRTTNCELCKRFGKVCMDKLRF